MDRIVEVRRRLGDDLPRLASLHEVPGVSVAVLVDGQVVEGVSGVVNLRTGVQETRDALFMIQSITKVWTATSVMQLVDDGLVALDTPVRTYLPAFPTADEPASANLWPKAEDRTRAAAANLMAATADSADSVRTLAGS